LFDRNFGVDIYNKIIEEDMVIKREKVKRERSQKTITDAIKKPRYCNVNARVDEETYEKLVKYAVGRGQSISRVVWEMLREKVR
jgi:predicted HicB family RNase H-like nuclease